MTFKIGDDRFRELLQIEEEVNCDIGAGYVGIHLREFLTAPVHFQQMRRLQAIVLEEFQTLLDELNLGIGKAAAWESGRKLVLERLTNPPVEIQDQLWAVLQEDEMIRGNPQPKTFRTAVKDILQTTLTQADWTAIGKPSLTLRDSSSRIHPCPGTQSLVSDG